MSQNGYTPEPGIGTFLAGLLTVALAIGLLIGCVHLCKHRIETMRTQEVGRE